MPDAPQVTITDPSDPLGPGDVLESAPARPPVSRRLVAGVLTVVALVGGGVLVTTTVQDRRTQHREDEAARVEADRVSLAFDAVSVGSGERRGGLQAYAQVARVDADRTVTAVRWVAEGIRPLVSPPPLVLDLSTAVQAEGALDCSAVAAGRVPTGAVVDVDVRPPSGRVRTLHLSVPDGLLRVGAYRSCQLPDPEAQPYVNGAEMSAASDGTVNVQVQPVPFGGDLVVRSARAAGFSVSSPFVRLPHRIGQDTTTSIGFVLRVTDCAVARGAELEVVLDQGGQTYVLVPQGSAGDVSVADRLASIVADAC